MKTMKWVVLLILAAALSLGFLVACGEEEEDDDEAGSPCEVFDDDDTSTDKAISRGDDASADDDDTADDDDDESGVTILDLQAVPNPMNNLTAYVTFTTNVPTVARIDVTGPDGHAWSLGPTEAYRDSYNIPIVGMYAESDYLFTVTVWNEKNNLTKSHPITFTTGPLPQGLPPIQLITTDPERMQPGIILFNVYRWDQDLDVFFGIILGVDETGRIVWYNKHPYLQGNFKYRSNGNLMHSVWIFFAVEEDFMGNFHNSWSVHKLHTYSMHHDFYELPWGEFMTFGSEVRTISGYPGNATYNVVGDRIAWFDYDSNLIKEWNLFDYLNPLRTQVGFHDDTFWHIPYFYIDSPKDWTHANGILYDNMDHSVIVSLRNQSWLIKIDMETDDLVWKLGWEGDFTMVDGGLWQWHQHAPTRMDNGHLLLYDNGNGRWLPPGIRRFTRIVEFDVNEENMTVEQVWHYLGDPHYFAPFLGDVNQLSNGNILICDGGLYTNPYDPADMGLHRRIRIKEITYEEDPETVFELYIYDPNVEYSAYNGIKIEDFYSRIYPPGP